MYLTTLSREAAIAGAAVLPSTSDETNHRVANSLQLLTALLAMEARDVTDPAAVAVLERMRLRIAAVGGVHRHLYLGTDTSTFDLGGYLRTLGEQIVLGGADHRRVIVAAEPVHTDCQTASSIGILTVELATNAFKHAYAAGAPASVIVSLHRLADGVYEFVAEDRGRGLDGAPPASGLGARLIAATVARLGGTAVWEDAQPGTRFRMTLSL
ncbi:sensor histidine kinase [Sphingomonas endolithica]|uniref:sensor histidine kinase n=1 Tax=Sphingomonas endolithica TaxID=2972485 RepID=UPI0021AF6842|nr:sensor histidine kinase [Sphingomonas sp. ZFBP2030]